MISLTRINGAMMVVNAELIEFVEANPDTLVTLSNGHKYLIKDTVEDVVDKVVEYKRSIRLKPLTEKK